MPALYRLLFALLALPGLASASPSLESDEFRLLRWPDNDQGDLLKWGEPVLGTPAVVTYAFAYGSFPTHAEVGDCGAVDSLSPLLWKNSLSPAQFEKEAAAGLALWEEASGVRFKRVQNPAEADILFGASVENHDFNLARAGLGLADAAKTRGGVRSIVKGAICFDSDVAWTFAPAHDPDTHLEQLSVRMTVAHEVGHVIGLHHPRSKNALMQKTERHQLTGLMQGDREGIQILYGN